MNSVRFDDNVAGFGLIPPAAFQIVAFEELTATNGHPPLKAFKPVKLPRQPGPGVFLAAR